MYVFVHVYMHAHKCNGDISADAPPREKSRSHPQHHREQQRAQRVDPQAHGGEGHAHALGASDGHEQMTQLRHRLDHDVEIFLEQGVWVLTKGDTDAEHAGGCRRGEGGRVCVCERGGCVRKLTTGVLPTCVACQG